MTPNQHQQIKDVFAAALEVPTSERAAFVAQACADDSEMRREVESLLAFEAQADDFIEKPALAVAAELMAEDKAASLAGQQITHYQVSKLLGAGGMGEVYLAEDSTLGRKVALKLLPAQFTADDERVRRFEREAKAASALNHPNIITIHEIGASDHLHFIATEFIAGETLRQRLAVAKLKVKDALDIAIQIAAALAAAHEAGIIHRDIKPENVMIRSDGIVKVLDFGLAKLTEAVTSDATTVTTLTTEQGRVMGTVAYMSPEQLRAQNVDERADLWSLGVVLYEMVAGFRPFVGPSSSAVIAAILEQSLPLLNEAVVLPDELQRILQKALHKNRAERYQTAHELLSELKALRDDLEFTARLESTGKKLRRKPKTAKSSLRWTKRVGIIAVAILLAITVIVWGFRRQANLRWARGQIAQLEQLAHERKYFEAYDLAAQIKQYLPEDATIAKLRPTIADQLSVTSDPAGARVSITRFGSDKAEVIGTTPLSKHAFARGEYILRLEKEGFAPFERTINSTLTLAGNMFVPPDDPSDFKIKLIAADQMPDRMAFVPGGKYKLTSRTKPTDQTVELEDFFIDKYEVTNREYKEFISAGSYFNQQFWKQLPNLEAFKEIGKEFKDRTGLPGPRSWSNQTFPEGKAEHPVTDITWYEAAAYAAFRGKQLPTIFQWEKAARNGLLSYTSDYAMPWGGVEYSGNVVGHANFSSNGTTAVHSFPFGMSPFGCFNMAGNVSEWCLNELTDGFTVAGGSWRDQYYLFADVGTFPVTYSADRLGFRCVRNLPNNKGDQGAMRIDTTKQIPVYKATSAALFQALLSHFRYDPIPLDAQIIETKDTDEWRREKISFIGGNEERAFGYLYLPKSAKAPFQVLQFVPAGDVYEGFFTLSDSVEMQVAPFIKAGRAVWAVVFKGFKERAATGYGAFSWSTVRRREEVVRNATDLRRGLDYLATRSDMDLNRVAYYGYSAGATEGLIYAAVEARYRTIVFTAGGLSPRSLNWIAEASPPNFMFHLKAPKLLLNGRYDEVHPLKTWIEPLYQALPEPKRWHVYEAGHTPPLEIIVPVVNAWLDETMGVVRRE
ncbi:MAG TPA: protein kinase [Blastocatellia bacterium]|nr:protein kinase [Blastocatellia bacterium]